MMNNSEPIGKWWKKNTTVNIRYVDAIELIHEMVRKRENLGMEMSEWVEWSEEVVASIRDLFNISEEE